MASRSVAVFGLGIVVVATTAAIEQLTMGMVRCGGQPHARVWFAGDEGAPSIDFSVGEYFRQYVGLLVDGRRSIYISALQASQILPEWRSAPLHACDGGRIAFGVIYDAAHRDSGRLTAEGSAA